MSILAIGYSLQGSSQEVLYSLNLPGNPFQQPYFQVMSKADNANSTLGIGNIHSVVVNGQGELGSANGATWVTSDYVSYYWNSSDTWQGNGAYGAADWYTVVYGLSPYAVRGYSEGAAVTLYLQRPAQVQLPFIPSGGSTVYATLPDYSDMFLAQTAAIVSAHTGCGDGCGFPVSNAPIGSWYKYNPVIYTSSPAGGHCHHYCNNFGAGAVAFGTLQHISEWTTQNVFGLFYTSGTNYWPQTCSWGPYIPYFFSSLTGDYLSSCTFPQGQQGTYPAYSHTLPIAPIITPGIVSNSGSIYDSYMQALWMTAPEGDLGGNFSAAANMYLASPTESYSTVSMSSMNYYQLFAQNMQYFNYENGNYNVLYATPGEGIFSDCMQLAGMQAVSTTPHSAVFTGSVGSAGITGLLPMSGTFEGTTPFTIPQAFLSNVTQANFLSGTYFTNAQSGWTGALGPQESGLEYYLGSVPHFASMVPYLPLYFSDPGRTLKEIGTNYCSEEDFSEVQMEQSVSPQLHVSRESSPMMNFMETLGGTRKRRF